MPANPSLLILHSRLTLLRKPSPATNLRRSFFFSVHRHFSVSSALTRTRRLAVPGLAISANRRRHSSSSSTASTQSLNSNAADNGGSGRSGGLSSPPVVDALQKIDVNPPKGTRDFPPEEMRLRSWLFANFREVSQLFGFEEVDFPVLESEALFIRKAGEEIRDQIGDGKQSVYSHNKL